MRKRSKLFKRATQLKLASILPNWLPVSRAKKGDKHRSQVVQKSKKLSKRRNRDRIRAGKKKISNPTP